MASFLDQIIGQRMPVLTNLMQFTAARHELIAQNIANIDTPGYRMRDVSVADFQQAMADAVRRWDENGGTLVLRGRQVRTGADGRLTFQPDRPCGDMVFRDQADRQVEKLMTTLAENTLTYNLAAEMLRNQFQSLKSAIRQRQ